MESAVLLSLLQLASPALPAGGFNYSDGIETLVAAGTICDRATLARWLEFELTRGSIRVDAAVMVRAIACGRRESDLARWNDWLSAARDTAELRQQSWQMGNALLKLLADLDGVSLPALQPCNWAIAYGVAAARWHIDPAAAASSFLHGWATQAIGAGVKAIPLGQTAGQQILWGLRTQVLAATEDVLALSDDDLESCSWGLALASSAHEVQYSRLFRS